MSRKQRLIGEAKAKALKKANAYQRLFGSPDGKIVLGDLLEQFDRKLHVPGDPHSTHVRVGEYGVLQYIQDILELEIEQEFIDE